MSEYQWIGPNTSLQGNYQFPPWSPHRAKSYSSASFLLISPSCAWVGDITYIPTGEGWLHPDTVKDLCTKKIMGYAFSSRIDTQLTLAALDMTVHGEKPDKGLIFHSDRGVQYAAAYRGRLSQLCIRQSMSRKGVPYDNAAAENFFSCLKYESSHLRRFDTRAAV